MNALTLYRYLLGRKVQASKAFDLLPTPANRAIELAAGKALGDQVLRMRSAGIQIR